MTDPDDDAIDDFDDENLNRVQLKLQHVLDGETLETSVMALSALLALSVCLASRDKQKAGQMLMRVSGVMAKNIIANYDDYVEQYRTSQRQRRPN